MHGRVLSGRVQGSLRQGLVQCHLTGQELDLCGRHPGTHGQGIDLDNNEPDNFVLDLEFKVDRGTNSGVFIRTGDIKNSVQTGIEIQVYDSFGKDPVGKHNCGAVYDCLAPSKNSVKEAGQWNHMTLEAQGAMLTVILNDEQIINMNLDDRSEPHLNPDRSKNKFKTALRDFPRTGRIGFQDHGKKVWYRNIRIKPLGA